MRSDVAIDRQHPVLHRLTPMGERLDANRQLLGFVPVVLHKTWNFLFLVGYFTPCQCMLPNRLCGSPHLVVPLLQITRGRPW